MPDLNNYYAYRRTSTVIIIVVLILLFLGMFDARLEEIGKFSGLVCLAFLAIRWVFS